MKKWKYYNHAMIPMAAPHEEIDVEPNKKFWKDNKKALFARWTSEFDCGYETNWWYVIKDEPFDITTLKCDGIVNAANSQMLGCFCPNHGCIDNAIHTYAGIQLRLACAKLMERQGHEEETGKAKITPAFNLPCKYVLHTVGPIVQGDLTRRDCELLASCYRSCLELAAQNSLESMAFCCISTGEFHFPPREAAEIAVRAVENFKESTHDGMKVIFNVFEQRDLDIYKELLGAD